MGWTLTKLDALKPTEQSATANNRTPSGTTLLTEANGSNPIFSFRGTNIDEKTALDTSPTWLGATCCGSTAPPQGEDAIREALGRLEALWEAMNYLTIAGIIPGEEDGVEDVGEQFAHLEQMVAGVTKDDYPAPKIVAMENCFVKEGCFVVECIPWRILAQEGRNLPCRRSARSWSMSKKTLPSLFCRPTKPTASGRRPLPVVGDSQMNLSVLRGDCERVLFYRVPSQSVDLILTSPPYP